MSMVAGGSLAGRTIKWLGPRGHTTFSNLMTCAAFFIFAQARAMSQMWAGTTRPFIYFCC
eukprot:COSAG05_NODE_1476_length_4780_cov_9.024989_2_plen_60_part_00